jgi:hypothetical protein
LLQTKSRLFFSSFTKFKPYFFRQKSKEVTLKKRICTVIQSNENKKGNFH